MRGGDQVVKGEISSLVEEKVGSFTLDTVFSCLLGKVGCESVESREEKCLAVSSRIRECTSMLYSPLYVACVYVRVYMQCTHKLQVITHATPLTLHELSL